MNHSENIPEPTPLSLEEAQQQGFLSPHTPFIEFADRDLPQIRESNRIQRLGRVLRCPDEYLKPIGTTCLALVVGSVPKLRHYSDLLSDGESTPREAHNQTNEVQ